MTNDDQLYTYDDVERYSRVVYRGNEAYVIEKGDDVVSESDNRHIKIRYKDRPHNRDTRTIMERHVNKYLAQQRILWVDWNEKLGHYGH